MAGDITEDLRTKVSTEQHRLLDALCRARGESMQDRVRSLVADWISAELHAHTLRCRLLKGEGISGDDRGNVP